MAAARVRSPWSHLPATCCICRAALSTARAHGGQICPPDARLQSAAAARRRLDGCATSCDGRARTSATAAACAAAAAMVAVATTQAVIMSELIATTSRATTTRTATGTRAVITMIRATRPARPAIPPTALTKARTFAWVTVMNPAHHPCASLSTRAQTTRPSARAGLIPASLYEGSNGTYGYVHGNCASCNESAGRPASRRGGHQQDLSTCRRRTATCASRCGSGSSIRGTTQNNLHRGRRRDGVGLGIFTTRSCAAGWTDGRPVL